MSGDETRGRWWWRWLRRGALVVAILVLAAGLFAWWALGTAAGNRWVLGQVESRLPGTVTYDSVEGRLLRALTFHGLRYQTDEGLDVAIDRLEIDWRSAGLLRKHFALNRLALDGVRVVLPPAEETDEPTILPDVVLPYTVSLSDGVITDLEVVRDGETLTRIDRIALAGRMAGDRLTLRRLALEAPELAFEASGTIETTGAYPLALEASWTVAPPELPRVRGAGKLAGDLETLRLDQTIAEPLDADVTGEIADLLTTPRVDLEAAFRGLDLTMIREDLPAAPLAGELTVAGTVEDWKIEIDADAGAPLNARIQGTVLGSGTAPRFDLEARTDGLELARLRADLPAVRVAGTAELTGTPEDYRLGFSADVAGEPVKGHVDGRVEGSLETPRFEIDARVDELRPEKLRPDLPAARLEGTLALAGTLEQYRLETALEVESEALPPGTWRLAGDGDRRSFRIERLTATLPDGNVAARGTVAWAPRVAWDLALRGDGLDPSVRWPDWPGALAVVATTEGHLVDNQPVARFDVSELSGDLRGEPVEGTVRGAVDRRDVRLDELDLRYGAARLEASGELASTWALDWRLAVPDLSAALPDAEGSLEAQGTFQGTHETPGIRGTIVGNELAWHDERIGELRANVEANMSPSGKLSLELEALRLTVRGRPVASLVLGGTGSKEAHELELVLATDEGLDLRAAATGGLGEDNVWRGGLDRLELREPRVGHWQLADASEPRVEIGTGTAVVSDFCWRSERGGEMCTQVDWDRATGGRAAGTLEAVPLAWLTPIVPEGTEVSGTLAGGFEARFDETGLATAAADLTLADGLLVRPIEAGRVLRVPLVSDLIRLRLEPGAATARAVLEMPDQGILRADFTAPGYRPGVDLAAQPLDGTIQGELEDLTTFAVLVPDLREPQGRLGIDFRVAGTLAEPRIVGAARLTEGSAKIVEYNIRLTDVELVARSDGSGPLRLTGSMTSGGGTATVEGRVPLDAEEPITLRIEGERFLASDTATARVFASPEIDLTITPEVLRVDGTVRIPEAKLSVADQPGAITPSSDVVVVGGDALAQELGRRLDVRLRLVLGDDVHFEAQGFTARPAGVLTLASRPDGSTVGSGELTLHDGVYKAFGQEFKLDSGRLLFAGGPVDNPGLDMVVTREAKVDDVTAGMRIRGTLRDPEVEIFSDPDLPQSQALSYLVLGRPMGEATEGASADALLTRAATSLGMRQTNALLGRLGSGIGFEKVAIESDGTLDEAALVLGTYLSSRIYVSYGFGLFKPISTLTLRYIIDLHWTFQAEESDEGTGADILYTVDR